jgi:hypothetical protein
MIFSLYDSICCFSEIKGSQTLTEKSFITKFFQIVVSVIFVAIYFIILPVVVIISAMIGLILVPNLIIKCFSLITVIGTLYWSIQTSIAIFKANKNPKSYISLIP